MSTYSTPLLVPGRIADREAEARARRLAREARGATDGEYWMTGGLRAARRAGTAILARVHRSPVKVGAAFRPAVDRS